MFFTMYSLLMMIFFFACGTINSIIMDATIFLLLLFQCLPQQQRRYKNDSFFFHSGTYTKSCFPLLKSKICFIEKVLHLNTYHKYIHIYYILLLSNTYFFPDFFLSVPILPVFFFVESSMLSAMDFCLIKTCSI